jgi:cytochrome c5/ketosteroid isomerase-like protein
MAKPSATPSRSRQFVLFLSCFAMAGALPIVATFAKASPQPVATAATGAILTADSAVDSAIQTQDGPALRRLLTPDFVQIHSGALKEQIEGPEAYIGRLTRAPKGLYRSRELRDREVTTVGDIALVTGWIVVRMPIKDADDRVREDRYTYLRVYRRGPDGWRLRIWHSGWAVKSRAEADFVSTYLATYPFVAPPQVTDTVTRGPAVYRTACASCHEQGTMGAPSRDDAEYWTKRLASIGRDELNGHAVNGYVGQKGVMPAKGGRSDLSDADVIAAVDVLTARAGGAH